MYDFTKHPRFWSKVNIGNPSECWEWQAFRSRLGYGRLMFQGKVCAAHRVSWAITNGEIPDGLCVLHKCDNRACVNPNHLFLGTQVENIQDMIRKGRKRNNPSKGEASKNAKLTTDDIHKIRQFHAEGKSHKQIAKMFGICFQEISKIVRGERWAHIK